MQLILNKESVINRKIDGIEAGDESLCLTYTGLSDMDVCVKIADSHEKLIHSLSGDDRDDLKMLVSWMKQQLKNHLKEWNVETELNSDNITTALKNAPAFWLIFKDFVDLVTEHARGVPLSVKEDEIKNLMRLGMLGNKQA